MFKCNKCGVEKDRAAYADDWHLTDGRKKVCKACVAAYVREYRQRPEAKAKAAALAAKYHQRTKHLPRKKELQKQRYARWIERSPHFILYMIRKHALQRRPTIDPPTVDDLMALWRAQDGKCAVTGKTLAWNRGQIQPHSISLDRIDSARGYEKDNIRLVCYQVNTFKGRWNDEQMFAMALAIVANMKKPKLRLVS